MTIDNPAPQVESYRLRDVLQLWSRERLVHEIIIARELARAVVCDGLRLQSLDGRWVSQGLRPVAFQGYPYVGYTAGPNRPLSILRISALNHLFAIVERGEEPDPAKLQDEFILHTDFRDWLMRKSLALPAFWFGAAAQ